MRFFKRFVMALLGLTLFGLLAGIGGAIYLYYNYGQDLPDEAQLANYAPAIVTRVHAGDGSLLAEYAIENRVFVPLDVIPEQVKLAFIAAEDQNFYSHPGVDFMGVLRAAIQNLKNMGSDARPIGASTITQQVAKNFLLTNEVSLARKIKEAILAFRIESAFTKDQILELYLNEIYLGRGNYGVVTAALNYFDKSLAELTLAETAYLAALPKAPANYDPERQKTAAIERRNYVLDRMAEDGYITVEEAATAKAEDLVIHPRVVSAEVKADYFAEEVRRQIQRIYGDDALYKGGLVVRSTLDPRLQMAAEKALHDGLYNYDRNHGWRGPVARMIFDDEALAKAEAERQEFIAANPESPIPPLPYDARVDGWKKTLPTIPVPPGSSPWVMAVVLDVLDAEDQVQIGLIDGTRGYVPMAELTWARPWLPDQRVGAEPKKPSDVLALGDVILVEAVTADAEGKAYEVAGAYGLRQIPNVSGAFLAMDPHTGRVLAMVGGWSFEESEFNRATQAFRQPGSSFKPYVYLAALEAGFTPATIVLDAPFVLDQGPGEPKWKPKNYGSDFLGPVTMRVGIEKSRNLMTVRLAQTIGMPMVVDYARRFGVIDDMPAVLSMALGSTETTLLRNVMGYAQIANGCKKITATFIDKIQDRFGKVIYRHDERPCPDCLKADYDASLPPTFSDDRVPFCDPISAYQMTTMLQGVVQRGTGSRVAVVGKPIAGKTGTTNENFDVWFVGFTPDLAAGVYIGFDQPRTLGSNDTGSSVASPIFRDFMLEALKDAPATPFRVPPGVAFVPIDQASGQVSSGGAGSITEAFKPGTEPKPGDQALDGGYTPGAEDNTVIGVPGVY